MKLPTYFPNVPLPEMTVAERLLSLFRVLRHPVKMFRTWLFIVEVQRVMRTQMKQSGEWAEAFFCHEEEDHEDYDEEG